MPIDVLLKTPLPRTNVLIRLTAKDTEFLLARINDAVQRGTGANLILEGLSGAACLIRSKERGLQVSLNAYVDNLSYRVETPMKGYNGSWSHVELVMDALRGREQLARFVWKSKV